VQSCHALNCKLCVQIFLTYQIIIHMLLMLKRKCLLKMVNYPLGAILLMIQNLQSRRYVEKLPV